MNAVDIYDLKKYIVFYKKTCSGCHEVIKYLDDNNIRYDKYDLDTAGGLGMAGMCEVLSLCMKMVPVIIENDEK